MAYKQDDFFRGSKEFPIGLFSQNSYREQAHHHIEYEIFYIDSGSVEFGMEESITTAHSGDVIFMHPGTNHYIKKINNTDYHYYAMVFDSSVLGNQGDTVRSTLESIRVSSFIKLPEPILEKLRLASEKEKLQTFGHELLVKSVLFDIIAHVLDTHQYVEIRDNLRTERGHSVNAIDVTLSYIHEHYRENISLDDVLKITSYSKSHFIRLFKKNVGMNLTDYINKYRIEKSCLDLIYTSKNVTEIATENGFNTVQYFSKTFKSYMKCTPKQYQRNGKNIIIPSTSTAAEIN
ncbi:MAG: helix-turn-helix domain-containing protein [Treponema sp.]|nr:helix-turn-helix domain-containing protein [Treponema sp.]